MPSKDEPSKVDYSQFVGHVDDNCGVSRCRQPAALRYCGTSMCARHWIEECERQEREESKLRPPEPEPEPEPPWKWGY